MTPCILGIKSHLFKIGILDVRDGTKDCFRVRDLSILKVDKPAVRGGEECCRVMEGLSRDKNEEWGGGTTLRFLFFEVLDPDAFDVDDFAEAGEDMARSGCDDLRSTRARGEDGCCEKGCRWGGWGLGLSTDGRGWSESRVR